MARLLDNHLHDHIDSIADKPMEKRASVWQSRLWGNHRSMIR